ncbi:MAG: anthranilate synthase component I family protein [Pyrinomonadaceae bacterium]|nr:anthranilate synthase component I family protein [Pyrinomonadaceae bacterium]
MAWETIKISTDAESLALGISALPAERFPTVLDSSGVGHLGSHLLIAGVDPIQRIEIQNDAAAVLNTLAEIESSGLAAIFTLSYDFGDAITSRSGKGRQQTGEPFFSVSLFDSLILHDYRNGTTKIAGQDSSALGTASTVATLGVERDVRSPAALPWTSNFSRSEYLSSVENIKEFIRRGDTYQANLTQQISVTMDANDSPSGIFARLRKQHPAPFAAFIQRDSSTVVSASPERFFSIADGIITASPIKGTRRRGRTAAEDDRLKAELLSSAKDRAENTMIVDLLRNDFGRVCEFGSVRVEKLCDLEEHPTLFHLVSTISGELRGNIGLMDVISAVFPCGSITGAPRSEQWRLLTRSNRTREAFRWAPSVTIFLPVSSGFRTHAPILAWRSEQW